MYLFRDDYNVFEGDSTSGKYVHAARIANFISDGYGDRTFINLQLIILTYLLTYSMVQNII
jgi:hypothetical protein